MTARDLLRALVELRGNTLDAEVYVFSGADSDKGECYPLQSACVRRVLYNDDGDGEVGPDSRGAKAARMLCLSWGM